MLDSAIYLPRTTDTRYKAVTRALIGGGGRIFIYSRSADEFLLKSIVFKPIFHLATLFARTDKKVGTLPTCSQRIFLPANFNQSCCRILVFASRRAKKVAKWKIGFRDDFKKNSSGRTQISEYPPPPPPIISALVTALPRSVIRLQKRISF